MAGVEPEVLRGVKYAQKREALTACSAQEKLAGDGELKTWVVSEWEGALQATVWGGVLWAEGYQV